MVNDEQLNESNEGENPCVRPIGDFYPRFAIPLVTSEICRKLSKARTIETSNRPTELFIIHY